MKQDKILISEILHMTRYRLLAYFLIFQLSISFGQSVKDFSCATISPQGGQLKNSMNITVLMDVSDRVTGSVSPGFSIVQHDADLSRILTESFICFESNKPIALWRDDLRFIMSPIPNGFQNVQKVNNSSLKFDAKSGVTKGGEILQGKNVLGQLGEIPTEISMDIKELESNILNESNFHGSDIYSFFAFGEVQNFINPDKRNVLIIITDGYIYHTDSKLRASNGVTYFTKRTFDGLGLNLNNYKDILSKPANQLIPLESDVDLKDLEVYVFGVDSGWRSKAIEFMWDQWLDGKVKNIEVYPLQNPAIQEQQILDIVYGE